MFWISARGSCWCVSTSSRPRQEHSKKQKTKISSASQLAIFSEHSSRRDREEDKKEYSVLRQAIGLLCIACRMSTEPKEVKSADPGTHGHSGKRAMTKLGGYLDRQCDQKRGDCDCCEADYAPVKPYTNTSLLKVGFHGGCGEEVSFLGGRGTVLSTQERHNGQVLAEFRV